MTSFINYCTQETLHTSVFDVFSAPSCYPCLLKIKGDVRGKFIGHLFRCLEIQIKAESQTALRCLSTSPFEIQEERASGCCWMDCWWVCIWGLCMCGGDRRREREKKEGGGVLAELLPADGRNDRFHPRSFNGCTLPVPLPTPSQEREISNLYKYMKYDISTY